MVREERLGWKQSQAEKGQQARKTDGKKDHEADTNSVMGSREKDEEVQTEDQEK